jgi:lipopolysaccharide export system protein LptA
VVVKAASGVFEHDAMRLTFSGGVTAEQEREVMSGDALYTTLNKDKRVEKVDVRGNAYLRSMEPGRSAELRSVDMDFYFDKDQRLQAAVATNNFAGRTLDADSEMQISGPQSLEVRFQAQTDRSLLREMYSGARSVVTLAAPKSKANDPRSANKRLTADALRLYWRVSGRDLERAEANGNAELVVDPVNRNPQADKRTLTATNLTCNFLDVGNLTKDCNAVGGAKVVMDPVQPVPNRGTRTLTSQTMAAVFLRETQDIDRLEAQGDSKFNENDRNGIAATISYTSGDETVRLRGGDPTVWDSRGRTKATELDTDLKNQVSYSRGRTATTYYSQEQTGGSTPFSKVKSPVYVVSDRGEFYHERGLAVYLGNARAWQDDNFVRGDKLNIYLNDKRMESLGHVQSAIYDSKRRIEGRVSSVPVFAAADNMSYSDAERLVHYEGNVDIKQGTDRMTAAVADVYLLKESNEMDKTIAQRNVVITQPNRKGTGDWVQYTAADEIAVLKGNPARVDDTEQGSTQGNRLTLSMRDSKVTADDTRGPLSPGRIRSTHKIKKP